MEVCILCPDENIKVVRERAKQIPAFSNHTALSIPVSGDGELPVTHWFCKFNASDEVYQAMKDLQQFTEIEESNAVDFLSNKNLKVIPLKKIIADRNARRNKDSE